MKKFEYKILVDNIRIGGQLNTEKMDKLGSQGWEMVNYHIIGEPQNNYYTIHCILKRECT